MVVSSWDNMSRGVEQAIVAASKTTPVTDVRIYSGDATKLGVAKVKAGIFNATTAYLLCEEAYYGSVAVSRAPAGPTPAN